MTANICRSLRAVTAVLIIALLCIVCGCEKLDEDYGKSMPVESDTSQTQNAEIVYPEIKSTDSVMPKYFDISLFDEENYSKAYLGNKFKLNVTYCGSVIELPTTYQKMEDIGWLIVESGEYSKDSVITAGKNIQVQLYNEYANKIIAVFYNSSKSSKKLSKCDIVKFIIPENCLDVTESEYGHFWINGINNQSSIEDIVHYWGNPSHFYMVEAEHYYLDYFFSNSDKRSGITVHVDPESDTVISLEFSKYN